MAPKQPPPTLQQYLRMAPQENVCLVPYAAPFSALAACTAMGGVQPQPRPSANSSSHLSPPSDGDLNLLYPQHYVEEYHEADAAMVIMELKEYTDKFLPYRPDMYFLRGSAYSLMAVINLEIERGTMDNERWTELYIGALRLMENMFESPGFDRVGCIAKLPIDR